MSFYLVAALLALGDSTGASQLPAAKPQAEDRIVCSEQTATGTRFKKKLCMKVSEHETRRRNAQDEAKEFIDRAVMNPPGD